MTQTGKCDTCRQRKVKCDERRPKCGACKKRDRPCNYSYGKASAFIVQDPNQMTKHGKSKTTPVVYSLDGSENDISSSSTPSDLRITAEKRAENGQGSFSTLAPISKPKIYLSKKRINNQKRALEAYLQNLQEESAVILYQPSSDETTLIARYIGMLGSETADKQPISILGTWIQSIPSRIGSNTMIDSAVEFMINSYAAYRDGMLSKQKVARASKAKALRELQLIVLNTQSRPTYDALLATKMHFAAEVLLGVNTMYHAIHVFGLAELLKSGTVTDVDDEHYWNFIDNTYIDDVNEAMMTGRKSSFDNEFYLSATYPPPFDSPNVSLSASQRASMAIMHVFIQCPRATCLIRQAIADPEDVSALAAAVSHVESLIQLNISRHVSELMQTAVTVVPIPPSPDIADIMPDTLEFSSVQSMILCTRYWMLQNVLCGFADTLYRNFPTESALSLLPSLERVRTIDVDSALHLAKSLKWAYSTSQKLPLVPLRLHTPLQISIGPWYRTIRDVRTPGLRAAITDAERSRAIRMKAWIIHQCNLVHLQWDVSLIDEKAILECLDNLAGEKRPDWLPSRVRFEAENGEMVMKLDYDNQTENYVERYDLGEGPARLRAPPGVVSRAQAWQEEHGSLQEFPYRLTQSAARLPASNVSFDNAPKDTILTPSWTKRPADFLHGSGRNLCATSGWWPETPRTTTIPIDSTHESSKLPQMYQQIVPEKDDVFGDADSHPCLASSWWPQTPYNLSASSNSTPRNFSMTPAPSTATTVTFDNGKKNACFSPAWTDEG